MSEQLKPTPPTWEDLREWRTVVEKLSNELDAANKRLVTIAEIAANAVEISAWDDVSKIKAIAKGE